MFKWLVKTAISVSIIMLILLFIEWRQDFIFNPKYTLASYITFVIIYFGFDMYRAIMNTLDEID